MSQINTLAALFEGWEGYHTSIVNAIAPLTPDQLAWRPRPDKGPEMRSVGEIVRHIALGRLEWFVRMPAPVSEELASRIPEWETDSDGARFIVESALPITEDVGALLGWLNETWRMVDATLNGWTVDDLDTTFVHGWNGEKWAVTRQWVLWRIMAHDIHHGGEISLMLGMQGIEAFELQALGGHIVLPKPLLSKQSSG